MARVEEKKAFTSTYSTIIREHEQEGNDLEDVVSSSGCCCFGIGSWTASNHESKYLLQQNNNGEQYKESWFLNKLKKLREFSELVAGPKWKNLVRKIGKHCHNPRKSRIQSMYSPQSYALNFDDGEEEFVSFSSRFSAPSSSKDQQRTASSS